MHSSPICGTAMFLEASQNASRNMAPQYKASQGILMFPENVFRCQPHTKTLGGAGNHLPAVARNGRGAVASVSSRGF